MPLSKLILAPSLIPIKWKHFSEYWKVQVQEIKGNDSLINTELTSFLVFVSFDSLWNKNKVLKRIFFLIPYFFLIIIYFSYIIFWAFKNLLRPPLQNFNIWISILLRTVLILMRSLLSYYVKSILSIRVIPRQLRKSGIDPNFWASFHVKMKICLWKKLLLSKFSFSPIPASNLVKKISKNMFSM